MTLEGLTYTLYAKDTPDMNKFLAKGVMEIFQYVSCFEETPTNLRKRRYITGIAFALFINICVTDLTGLATNLVQITRKAFILLSSRFYDYGNNRFKKACSNK